MKIEKSLSRGKKQYKRRHGMQVDGTSVKVLIQIIQKKAKKKK